MAINELRSPEWPYRIALLLVLAAVSIAMGVAADSASESAVGVAGSICLALLAWRATKVRLVIGESTISDVGMFGKRTYVRRSVTAVGIGRGGGLIDGYCIILSLEGRRDMPLRASRAYSLVPSTAHLMRLGKMLEVVRRWRQEPRGASDPPIGPGPVSDR